MTGNYAKKIHCACFKVKSRVFKSTFQVMNGKNGEYYLEKPLFCAKEIPNTEGMEICLGLELMLYLLTSHLQPCSQMNTIPSSNRNGITRAQFQDKNG